MSRSKRLFDIIVSGTALLLLSPAFLVIAIAIWLESGRPIFFAQERIGYGFVPFTLWKFRSMRSGTSGPLITACGDSRITRAGRFLRVSKLDEFPQLWNVLRGDMSLVGPRPEVRRYVDLCRTEYSRILSVRPGITDPASIEFRHEEQLLAQSDDRERLYVEQILPAKLRLSQQYVAEPSLRRDFVIITQTMFAVAHVGGRWPRSVPPALWVDREDS